MHEDSHAFTNPVAPALRRWARRAMVILAAMFAAYLVVGNLLLNTGLGHSLVNRQPEKFVAAWGTAWTLYPGHVRITDLRVAGHIRRVIWSVQADSASGRIALLPLLARELRVPLLRAAGVSGGASLIDDERAPPTPRPGGWTVRFEHIVAGSLRHAYFQDVVLQGDGSAEAGFVKVLRGGPMQVLPSQARFTRARTWRDGVELTWDTAIDARVAIARHLRSAAPGLHKLEKTDLEIGVEATTAGLSIVSRPGGKPELRVTRGPGHIEGRVAWRQGVLEPGGSLRLAVPVLNDFTGELRSAMAEATLDIEDADLHLTGMLEPIASGTVHANADLRVRGRNIPLSDVRSLLQRSSGHIVADWHFDSLAWLAGLLPGSRLVAFDGAGSVRADLRLADGEVAPGSVLDVPHVAATARALGSRFDGDASAKVRFEALTDGSARPRLDVLMQKFRVAAQDAPDQPYVLGRDLRIEATAAAEPGDLRERLSARLQFANAEVPDLRVYNRYLPRTSLRFDGGAGRLGGDLSFDGAGDVGRGLFKVDGKDVRMSLAGLQLEGDVTVDTRLERADLARHRFIADGSRVTLRRIRVLGADAPQDSDWWGEIELDQARLDWDKPVTLDGRLRARMKDVSLLLDVYQQRKHLPGWVEKLVDSGEATAQGRLRWKGDTLLLQPFAASNARFDVLARLRLQSKKLEGDLLARWGALSVGVEISDGQRDLNSVGPAKWFEGRPELPWP